MLTDTKTAGDVGAAKLKSYEMLVAREERLKQVNKILILGIIANGILFLLLLIATILTGIEVTPGLISHISDLTMIQSDSSGDVTMLTTILIISVNFACMSIVMVALSAQELWALLLGWSLVIVNVILLASLMFTPALVTIIATGMAVGVATRDIRAFRINPIMSKEVRERMRGVRSFSVITVYLGLMGGFTLMMYLLQRGVMHLSSSSATGELGRSLFAGMFGLELVLIVFIAPAFTSGAISNERERNTYELLQITLLPKASFIVGKLESALNYIFLLLLATIPLQSISFLFGGVGQIELALVMVILVVTALTLGAIGIFFSTMAETTLAANTRAYTVAAIVAIGAPIVLGVFVDSFNNAVGGTAGIAKGNLFLEAAFIYIGALIVSLNPVLTAFSTQQLLLKKQEIGIWMATLSDGSKIPVLSPWISLVVIYLIVTAVMTFMAIRRMQQMDE
jgi:ABC-2 type transport system permease protein